MKKTLLLFITLLCSLASRAGNPDTSLVLMHIRSVTIEDNHRTKEHVIRRALTFAPGDSIPLMNLIPALDRSKNNLINTGLFYDVSIKIENWVGKDLDVKVKVTERWYTYPIPTLDLYDRNFNNWWVENNHNLNRIQYGIRFLQKNVRGRNEDLRINALLGYAQKFEASYYIPYFDKRQKNGFLLYGAYGRNKIVAYETDKNKQLFYQNNDVFVRSNWGIEADWIHQPGFHLKQVFAAAFNQARITDTISRLNPDYFLNGRTREEYVTLSYTFSRDYRDIRVYPLKGSYFEVAAVKTGLGLFDNVDITSLQLTYHKYLPVGKKVFLSWQSRGKASLPSRQPYYNQKALGYRTDYVSGYEYYVVDGQQFALGKLDAKYQLFKLKLQNPWTNGPVKTQKFPFTIYLKAQGNAGYVNDDFNALNNPLNNTLLLGGGPGIDIVLFYDIAIKVEYSWNGRGESGWFLHLSTFAL